MKDCSVGSVSLKAKSTVDWKLEMIFSGGRLSTYVMTS